MPIVTDALERYAAELHENGFEIYVPVADSRAFTYAQQVGGVLRYGEVVHYLGSRYQHFMCVRGVLTDQPCGIRVRGVPNELTVDAAAAVAQPSNFDPRGTQWSNWVDAAELMSRCSRWV